VGLRVGLIINAPTSQQSNPILPDVRLPDRWSPQIMKLPSAEHGPSYCPAVRRQNLEVSDSC
jgi:hypothetical protein